MNAILNISAYCFVPLPDAERLCPTLEQQAVAQGLKGTIIVASEGINLFLAGSPEPMHGFLAWLRTDARLARLEIKESWSETQPFRKLRVRFKREIIRMNHPAIRPTAGRAPAVTPQTLKRWLDAGQDDDGRAVVTLDTRNAFEVDQGRFAGALDWRIDKFSEFPTAVLAHMEALRDKTVVTYCTGGIRCEKAAIFMHEAGLEHVVQLDGGILRYFEEVGGDHFIGHCFVFDERVALAPDLSPMKP